MANYQFVVNSNWTPLTMQEMLVPFNMYKEAYDKDVETINSLYDKTDPFRYLDNAIDKNDDRDKDAREIYDNYVKDLRNAAQKLNERGLSDSRRDILNIRRRYAGEIGRLEKADTARNNLIKVQMETSLKDPTRMYATDARTSSLSDYLDNRLPNTDSYSGAMLAQQASTAGAAIAKGLVDVQNGGKLDEYNNLWKKQYGLDVNEVAYAVSHPRSAEANQLLRHILDNVVGSTTISTWGSDATLNQAYNYAAQGLWSTVGQTQVDKYDNYGAKLAAQTQAQKDLIDHRAQKEAEQAGLLNGNNSLAINPQALRSQEEINTGASAIDQYIKDGYLVRNKHGLQLTNSGLNALRTAPLSLEEFKQANPKATEQGYTVYRSHTGIQDNNFANWYNREIGGFNRSKWGTGHAITPTERLNKYNQYIHSPQNYDTFHTTEYERAIDQEDQTAWKQQLWEHAGSEGLEQVDFGKDENGKRGFNHKKWLDKDDLKGYKPVSTRDSKYGNTVMMQDEDGETVRVRIPSSMQNVQTTRLNMALQKVDMYDEILRKGYAPRWRKDRYGQDEVETKDDEVQYTNTPLADYDRVAIDNLRKEALQEAYVFGGNRVVRSKTKRETIPTINW